MSYQNTINSEQLSSVSIVVYNSSGTYNVPADLKSLQVECLGGGGGSGACAATAANEGSASGGGGSGAYTCSVYPINVLTSPVTVTVGAGGTAGVDGGANGGNGGTSSFYLDSASGGGGTANGSASSSSIESAGGAGGVASGGQFLCNGFDGLESLVFATTVKVLGNVAQLPGQFGVTYSAGGSNRINDISSASQAGQAGSPGCVILTEFRGGP